MNRGEFIIFYLFVALAVAALLNLAFVALDRRPSDQAMAKRLVSALFLAWLVAVIALPIIDLRGGPGGKSDIPRKLFALPDDVALEARQSKEKTPVCWQDRPGFSGSARLDARTLERLTRDTFGEELRAYVASHYDTAPSDIAVEPGALDWREAREVHDLRDGEYWSPIRLAMMLDPFICAAIERNEDGVRLRPCDPIAKRADTGSSGRVRIVIDRESTELEYLIAHGDAPRSCRNPVRRIVNRALGLEHPR